MKKIFSLLLIFSFAATVAFVSFPATDAQATGITVPTTGQTGLSGKSFQQALADILEWIITMFVILAVIAFVVTGIMFLLSFGGDAHKKAKDSFVYSVIGVVVTLSALIVINGIKTLLS